MLGSLKQQENCVIAEFLQLTLTGAMPCSDMQEPMHYVAGLAESLTASLE